MWAILRDFNPRKIQTFGDIEMTYFDTYTAHSSHTTPPPTKKQGGVDLTCNYICILMCELKLWEHRHWGLMWGGGNSTICWEHQIQAILALLELKMTLANVAHPIWVLYASWTSRCEQWDAICEIPLWNNLNSAYKRGGDGTWTMGNCSPSSHSSWRHKTKGGTWASSTRGNNVSMMSWYCSLSSLNWEL